MKEYLYLWIHKHTWMGKDDQDNSRYLFENVGVRLSSKYNVTCNFNEESKALSINVEKGDTIDNYFSEYINDLVAVIGNNGAGKSSLLKSLKYILTRDCRGSNTEYVLIYTDGKNIRCTSTLEENIKLDLDKNITLDPNGEELHKSDYLIFYSPFFNVNNGDLVGGFAGDFGGSADISTENVIGIYSNKLLNSKYTSLDRLDSYSYYEQQIELDFMANFLEHEKVLPMDLPAYFYVQSNHTMINSFKKDIQENKDEWLLKIFEKWKENAHSLQGRTYLSVFACLYRAHRMNRISPTYVEFDKITEKTNIEDAINKISEANNRPGIINDLKTLIDTIEKNSDSIDEWDGRYLFLIKRKEKTLKQIMKLHYDIKGEYLLLTPFLLFKRQRLSTGEDNFIQFFARFYNIWKENKTEVGNISSDKNIVYIIDEGEAGFHPEWQRIYIKTFIEWLKLIMDSLKMDGYILRDIPKFQILLSTHSPFVACDLPKNNMVCLRLSKKTSLSDFKSVKIFNNPVKDDFGIGARIIDLLKSDFFIDSTVGALATDKITGLIDEIREKGHENLSAASKFILNNLGDQLIKSFLEEGE